MIAAMVVHLQAEPKALLWGYAAVLAALSLGTTTSLALMWTRPSEASQNLRDRMR